jgi:nucleotide-binding universal stress UspA family protein
MHPLVAIDTDEAVPRLVGATKSLLADIADDVVVLHVRERQPRGVELLSAQDAEQLVGRAVAALGRSGVRARGRVRSCLPRRVPQTILEVAEEEGVEAIVVGTYRRSGFLRWLQGSVTRSLLATATLPVFAVPESERRPTRRQDPNTPNVVAINFRRLAQP